MKILFYIIPLFFAFSLKAQDVISFSIMEQAVHPIEIDTSSIIGGDSLSGLYTPHFSVNDSMLIKGFVLLSDTQSIHKIFFQIGNDSILESYNVYNDSISLQNLTNSDSLITKKGRMIKMDFGYTLKTDTIYGKCWIKRSDHSYSPQRSFPNIDNY
ncbi:MAG: hypothetical protein N4A74_08435 [Carboxylicivirga sp.]|jgi:hypothetical protein|nr:hypothetical protein [Carboxylicivirga sp.]